VSEILAVQLRPGDQVIIDGRTETVTSTELSPSGNCWVATDVRSEADAHSLGSFQRVTVSNR
jgi:hypothetical protein